MQKYVHSVTNAEVKGEDEIPSMPTQRPRSTSRTPETNGQAAPGNSRPRDPTPKGDMEKSLSNDVPYNDLTRDISEFLHENVVIAPEISIGHLEIEAKLGAICKDGHERVNLPVTTETVISPNWANRFASKMTIVSLVIDVLGLDAYGK